MNTNLVGKRFGRLVAIEKIPSPKKSRYVYKCDCGNIVTVRGDSLTRGDSQSCGCLMKERVSSVNTRYSDKQSKILAKRFGRIKERCLYPGSDKFHLYGARGITICQEWLDDTNKFIEWAKANGWKPNCGLTIDRIDVNGPYAPWNCRWVNNDVQQNNKRDNHTITVDDETKTIAQWADMIGIEPRHLYDKNDCELESLFRSDIEMQNYESLINQ